MTLQEYMDWLRIRVEDYQCAVMDDGEVTSSPLEDWVASFKVHLDQEVADSDRKNFTSPS